MTVASVVRELAREDLRFWAPRTQWCRSSSRACKDPNILLLACDIVLNHRIGPVRRRRDRPIEHPIRCTNDRTPLTEIARRRNDLVPVHSGTTRRARLLRNSVLSPDS
jgi:hypothetical protein